MSKVVFSSLKTAVKGTALLVTSSAASLLLWFFIKVLIIRNLTQAEFGIYSLAITVMSIATILASLGLFEGTARYISIARGEGDTEKVAGLTKSAFEMVSLLGVIFAAVLYLLSDALAIDVFNMPGLAAPLRIISFGVIISVMLNLITAISRGHGNMGVKAARDFAQPALYIIILAVVFMLKLPLIAVMAAFVLALALTLIGIFVHVSKSYELGAVLFRRVKTYRKELFFFSIPLLGVFVLGLIMTWTDTVMLGYFMHADDVGLYNAGISLSRLLMFAVVILNFVFMPIAGELYAKGWMDELKRTFQVLTKWVFMATFPLFLVLFFFPEMTLTFLFGKEYEAASTVLKILSLRFMFELLAGSSNLLLIVLGRTRVLIVITVISSALNIILNYTMIPAFGLVGAAFATLLSSLTALTVYALVLYKLSRIHAFTSSYLKPVVASAAIAGIIYAIAKSIPLYFWMLPVYFILFVGGYLLSILLTRSIEKEDVAMFDAVADKLGVELSFIKKIIERFAHN
jgi:O-antigen/teichoic acid export membrane protein